MREPDTNDETLALGALAWAVGEPDRASRLLDLTGLTPGHLRAAAGDRAVLAAVVGVLAAHEPDLVACADTLGVAPDALAAAGRRLSGEEPA